MTFRFNKEKIFFSDCYVYLIKKIKSFVRTTFNSTFSYKLIMVIMSLVKIVKLAYNLESPSRFVDCYCKSKFHKFNKKPPAVKIIR